MAGRTHRLAPYEWAYSRPHGKLTMDMTRTPKTVFDKLVDFMPRGRIRDDDDVSEMLTDALIRYSLRESGLSISREHIASEDHMLWDKHMTASMSAFSQYGRNVFTFDDELCQAFLRTDVDQVVPEDIVHPYTTYYLHFQMDEPIMLPHGRPLEGILVNTTPVEDEIRLTAMVLSPSGGGTWPDVDDWGYEYQAILGERDRDLLQAFEEVERLDAEEKTYLEEVTHADHPFVPGLIPQTPDIVRLLINSILYVTRYAADARLRYPAGAPAQLVEAADAGRRAAEKELTRLGYVRTRLVTLGGGSEEGDGSRGIRAHWRRGHWKNQPHGPRNSLRKLILVRPTRVSWKAEDDAPEMRTYVRRPVAADRAYEDTGEREV